MDLCIVKLTICVVLEPVEAQQALNTRCESTISTRSVGRLHPGRACAARCVSGHVTRMRNTPGRCARDDAFRANPTLEQHANSRVCQLQNTTLYFLIFERNTDHSTSSENESAVSPSCGQELALHTVELRSRSHRVRHHACSVASCDADLCTAATRDVSRCELT